MKNVGIIGGGIIGLCSAYYLNKSGHRVTVLDSGNFSDGCSFGNAGMIVPSHFVPLASPGMIAKGIRWMFDSKSPFYIKPRWNAELLKWGYYFYTHSTRKHMMQSIPALAEISLFSKGLYRQLEKELAFDFGYKERGLLMLYQTPQVEKEELETVLLARDHGIEAQVLSDEEVQRLEPKVAVSVRGGIYFPGDAHLTPQRLVTQLISYLTEKGVVFQPYTEVTDFMVEGGEVRILKTTRGDFRFDDLVLSAGAWSGSLSSKLKLSLPLQAGKGYSFTIGDVANNIMIPSILVESRVAVTPMGDALRFGGTMEIAGMSDRINMSRVRGMVDAIPKYYPKVNVMMPPKVEVWHGLRPCSPDGLPYIGRLRRPKNIILATGHAMMGMSLGPATGKLVDEIMSESKTRISVLPFAPERFN